LALRDPWQDKPNLIWPDQPSYSGAVMMFLVICFQNIKAPNTSHLCNVGWRFTFLILFLIIRKLKRTQETVKMDDYSLVVAAEALAEPLLITLGNNFQYHY